MNRAFIWDLDGTLLDSYGIIVDGLYETYLEYGIECDKENIHRHVIKYSCSSFIHSMEKETKISFETMKERYSEISGEKKLGIQPIPHAKEILSDLKEQGDRHFVFTHRGKSTDAVLQNLNLKEYFEEVITSQENFARKPAPDAIHYLIQKYQLNPANTFYVGDRSIDMECAKNAGVKGILYLEPNGYGEKSGFESYVVGDLLEIKELSL